ncbi:hypothetical protein ACHAXA_011016 [Cyclostephanos tholiformis]|uniref:Uncharacterized protein n=1 Tax=Cyclostephanos tholiformis TaxID=382380 RepID=A0ABD3R443_9STRA
MNHIMSSSSAKKKTSTSQTNLPDGSRIKEYVVEETNSDGSKTVTTTRVKTSQVRRTLPDGSQVTEEVSTTTTSTRHVAPDQTTTPPPQSPGNNVLVNAVGTFMDLFGGGGGNNNGGGGGGGGVAQRISCGAGSVLGGTGGEEDDTYYDGGINQRPKGGGYGQPPPQSSPAYDDISTLGDHTAGGYDSWDGAPEGQRQWHQRQLRQRQQQQQLQQQQQQHGGKETPASLPSTNQRASHHQDPPPTVSAFYPRNRHPNSGSPAIPASVGSSKKSGGGGGGSVGRNIIRTLTPLRSSGSNNHREEARSSSNRSSGGDSHRSGSTSGRRLNALGAKSSPGVGVSQYQTGAGISQYHHQQQPQQQRGQQQRGRSMDKHALDPEVINAIDLIRQRSKSPPRGRRGYMPPRSPGLAEQQSPFLEDQRLAHMEAIERQEQFQVERSGAATANYNEWDEDVSDERDDFATHNRLSPEAMTSRSRGSGMAMELISTKKKGTKQQQLSTIKRIQGKVPIIPPPTLVKHGQILLTKDTFTTITFAPKIVVHKTNAILTSDRYVHFYSLIQNNWVQTTSVSLANTQGLSFALCNDTAVVGVPYDRNSRGLLTGAAYIFERDAKTQTWYQVKKIVPKKVQEFANVGYSVDISENVVCVGVPELGAAGSIACSGGGGSVYVYQRAEQYKWMPMGHLTMAKSNLDPDCLAPAGGLLAPTTTGFGTIVALKHKILVVSNYQPNRFGGETSLFVYEYDVSLKNKWRLIQTDLLSTEAQQRDFGSRIALTSNGEGIFVGCHSDVNPTEILYYKRKAQVDTYGNRSYQLQQIITLQEKCNISDFCVDSNDNFIVGTLNSNRVYVYQQMHDPITLEDQGWRLMAKVSDSTLERQRFGEHVALFGNSLLVGTKGNVYSYSLEKWLSEARKKPLKTISATKSKSSFNWGKIRGIFAG